MSPPVVVLLRRPGQKNLAFCFPGCPTDLFPDQQLGRETVTPAPNWGVGGAQERGAGGKSPERCTYVLPCLCPLSPQVKQALVLPRPTIA